MLRGFRHTLFLLLQVGVILSGAIALALWPQSWRAVAVCLAGALLASLICERIASRYLRRTLGSLRRVADDLGRGRQPPNLPAPTGGDFHKLVSAINLVASRLAEAGREEQRLHEELRRRERLAFLGELAATVAHEVNNPLDGIQNCSRILRRSLVDDPQRAREMLDLIDSGLVRIDLIVRRLLTLAREHVIRPVQTRIRDVIEQALQATGTRFDERGIRVQRRYEMDEDYALVDPPLLQQVFVNILLNATDSMPDGGDLTIRIRCRRLALKSEEDSDIGCDAVCVEISDTGTGIAPDVLPHIFEPFFTTKGRGRGTGLGLAIATRIVDAHRGSLDVESAEGRGTTFRILLPAMDYPAEREEGALHRRGAGAGHGA